MIPQRFAREKSRGISHENPPERLAYPPREAAALLGICERTLFTLAKRGEIRARRIGRLVRYYRADLMEFLERENGDGEHHQ